MPKLSRAKSTPRITLAKDLAPVPTDNVEYATIEVTDAEYSRILGYNASEVGKVLAAWMQSAKATPGDVKAALLDAVDDSGEPLMPQGEADALAKYAALFVMGE